MDRYTRKDLRCCDSPTECEYCPNCEKYFNEKVKTALDLHRSGKCAEILKQ